MSIVFNLEPYIEKINNVESTQKLFEVFSLALAQVGIDVACFQVVTEHGIETLLMGSVEPQFRLAVCDDNKFDSVAKYAAGQSGAFYFNATQNEVVDLKVLDAVDIGICIPLRGPSGSFAVVKAIFESDLQIPATDLLVFSDAIAAVFYRKYCLISGDGASEVKLTQRESQVLQLASAGETKRSIAVVMGVTDHAVDFHYRNIMRKYKTNRMVVAVVKAARKGLV